jgi:syntaxin 5
MKESKDRTEQFMHSAASGANQAPSSQLRQRNIVPPADQPSPSGSLLMAGGRRQPEPNGNGFGAPSFPDPKGKSRSPQNGDILAMDLVTAEEGTAQENGGGAFMQMQLVEQQNDYIQSRSTAIESIESTIAELGQIFTQLAQMVAEQRETVQRIDADVMDISSNVSGAQRELLKYYSSISSNRWLMLKIFGVLIVFVSFNCQAHLPRLNCHFVVLGFRPGDVIMQGMASITCPRMSVSLTCFPYEH